MKLKKFNCCICGAEEDPNNWDKDCSEMLMKHQMCFTCNHWRQQHERDKERGDHNWAVIDGHHYVLKPSAPARSPFKGFGGHKFKFEFFDGHIEECDNVWFQGDITEAHPHWRKIMPDNARIIQ